MIIKRLRLYNFRPFMGEQQILFSTDEKHNVTLVHAENGVGKTSLLSAVLWCLYGRLVEGVEQPEDILNHEAAKIGENEYSVSLTIDYEGEEFEIIRKGYSDAKGHLAVYRIDDERGWLPIPESEAFVNSIVPSSMADYFFFHGEGSVGAHGKNIRAAIRDILGFEFAEAAIDELDFIERKYLKESTKLSGNPEMRTLEKALAKVEDEHKVAKEMKGRASKEEKILHSERLKLKEEMKNINDVKNLEIERGKLENRYTDVSSKLQQLAHQEVSFIGKYGWAVFARGLAKHADEFIDLSEVQGKFPSPFYETFIKDLLERGECICGEPLHQHSEKQARVRRLLASAANKELIERVSGARSKVVEIEILAKQAPDRWRTLREDVRAWESSAHKINQELDRIKEKIRDSDSEAAISLQNALDSVDIQLISAKRSYAVADSQQKASEVERVKLSGRLRVLEAENIKLNRLRYRQKAIACVKDLIKSKLEHAEKDAISDIEAEMTELLDKISRKNYTPILDAENDDLSMKNDMGITVGASTGERLLLNFVFISTLIKICRDRIAQKDEVLIPGATAPFVIDAPFGELDDTYKSQTAKFLPKRARQVILFLSTSHWQGQIQSELESVIGAEYILLSKNRVGEKKDKTRDPITLRGQTIEQSVYGSEYNMTEIMEVDW